MTTKKRQEQIEEALKQPQNLYDSDGYSIFAPGGPNALPLPAELQSGTEETP